MNARIVRTLACVTLAGLVGCGTTAKQGLIDESMRSSTQRRQSLEATLRVMDVHPDYVDEMYEATRRHPRTMERFLQSSARDLEDPALAKATADLLADNPRSLRQVLLATVDAAAAKPDAREAIASAVEERTAAMADIITDRPTALAGTLNDTVAAVGRKPAARKAFLGAMQKSAPRLSEILAKDPHTLMVLTEALVKEVLKDKEAAKKLAEMILAKVEGKAPPPAPAAPQ
ncbi:MAG: hypothetical protein JWM74_4724 [Myxococcaceae bacterium]|nr:hypothetical protein [Myxococcaceae bacterium]